MVSNGEQGMGNIEHEHENDGMNAIVNGNEIFKRIDI
jgi:hypothetical protein